MNMNNLQTEVIQIEFAELSKGAPTITELDFTRILPHYTFLNSEGYDNILERLQERIQEEKGSPSPPRSSNTSACS